MRKVNAKGAAKSGQAVCLALGLSLFLPLQAGAAATRVHKAGDTMTGALTLPGDPSSALQATPKQYVDSWTRSCVNPGNAADIMVPVGSWCVDKYEASVWSAATGGTQYGTASNNYPGADDGQTNGVGAANPIYARSVVSVTPSAYITWHRANVACINAGKELLPNAVWQAAAAGTPKPTVAGDACKAFNTPAGPSVTGVNTGCVSSYAVENMTGSLWEWVAEWGSYSPVANGVWPAGPGSGEYLYGNGSATIGAVLRGGAWGSGAFAGVFAFNANGGPSLVDNLVGFRCGRRR